MTRKLYWGHGPPQAWQSYPSDSAGDKSPIRRLYLMGNRGLPVGPGTRWMGGVSELTAFRLWVDGLVVPIKDDKKDIIHIYPRQISFSFV